MTRQEAIRVLSLMKRQIDKDEESLNGLLPGAIRDIITKQNDALDMAISILGAYDQVRWERDMALQTLEEHGIGLGQIADETLSKTEIVDLAKGDTIKEEDWVWGDAESATTTDCISRADIEYHTQLEANGNGQYEEVEVAYKSDIDNLPPCTPTERTGEWVTEKGSYEIICSECGCEAFSEFGTWFRSDYCPNCGAKMGGDVE